MEIEHNMQIELLDKFNIYQMLSAPEARPHLHPDPLILGKLMARWVWKVHVSVDVGVIIILYN